MSSTPPPSDLPQWFVCHTMPRCEKKFAALMAREHIAHYLPLIKSTRRYADGNKHFTKPLFPGYVFAEIIPAQKNRIYQRDLLVRTIWVEDQARLLRQIEEIKIIIASGLKITLQPLLKKGRPVRIAAGPLAGLQGMVDNPDDPRGIVVAVDVLQQGLLIPIMPEYLEVL